VTVLADPDRDGDGIPDSLDPDDDNDGQSDADEIAFGTDPLDPASVFEPRLARAAIPSDGFTLSFPAAVGITYVVEFGSTLVGWEELSAHVGTGQPVSVPLPAGEPARFYRVRVGG
jgi:hypothetical protein